MGDGGLPARGTSLNPGVIENVLQELRDAIVFFAKQGMNVKLSNIGTFSPTVDLGGTFDVAIRLDTSIDAALNVPGAFTGAIVNPENIGRTSAMLKEMWNLANSGDLIPGAGFPDITLARLDRKRPRGQQIEHSDLEIPALGWGRAASSRLMCGARYITNGASGLTEGIGLAEAWVAKP